MDAVETAIQPDFSNPLFWQPVTACMLCGGRNFREIMKAPDPHYGMPGLFPIFRCADCSLQFLNPQPTLAYLATAYPTEYYSYVLHPLPTGWRAYKRRFGIFLRRLLGLEIGRTRDPHFERPGTMLDIGCGAGDFLLRKRAEGWKVHGVEISAKAAEAGRSQGGLDIKSGTLPEAHFPDAFFDYVRTNHSFEHLHNPREVLKEIRRIIKPDGKLFIGVPNVASLPADMFGDCWYNLGPPTHPYGYSPKSLSRFLEQEGFEVEKVGYNSTFSGLIGSIQIRLNRGKGLSSEQGRVINNRILIILAHWVAQIIDAFQRGDCIEVIARPKP
jgi:Methylase involved in ubiquinone/menaquinone biosynthesis